MGGIFSVVEWNIRCSLLRSVDMLMSRYVSVPRFHKLDYELVGQSKRLIDQMEPPRKNIGSTIWSKTLANRYNSRTASHHAVDC